MHNIQLWISHMSLHEYIEAKSLQISRVKWNCRKTKVCYAIGKIVSRRKWSVFVQASNAHFLTLNWLSIQKLVATHCCLPSPRIIDLPLKLASAWLSPIPWASISCHFCAYSENEAHSLLDRLFYIYSGDKFPSLFENVVLGRLKFSSRLDHQVDISLYLMEVTPVRCSRALAWMTPSWSTLNPLAF